MPETIVRGLVRHTKPAADVAATGDLPQALAECRLIAERCAAVAEVFERLSAANADEQRAFRFTRLARGLRSTSEGIVGEIEDL